MRSNTEKGQNASTLIPPFVQPGELMFQHFHNGEALTESPRTKESHLSINESEEAQKEEAMDVDEKESAPPSMLKDSLTDSMESSSQDDGPDGDPQDGDEKGDVSKTQESSQSEQLTRVLADLMSGGKLNEGSILEVLKSLPKGVLESALKAGSSEPDGSRKAESMPETTSESTSDSASGSASGPALQTETGPASGKPCGLCKKFFLRPCELKYATVTTLLTRCLLY
jgi:hypothetical protein